MGINPIGNGENSVCFQLPMVFLFLPPFLPPLLTLLTLNIYKTLGSGSIISWVQTRTTCSVNIYPAGEEGELEEDTRNVNEHFDGGKISMFHRN